MGKNTSDSFEAGVNAGLEGQSASDNPHDRGVADGIFNALGTIALGGMSDLNAEQDRAASEWEAGRNEGNSLKNE